MSMLFKQWPRWLRWAIGFGIAYILAAAWLFFGALSTVYPTMTNADLHFITFNLVSFPGWIVSGGLAQLEFLPYQLLQAIVPIVSFCAYFLLGAGIGKVRENK